MSGLDFFRKLVEDSENEYVSIAADLNDDVSFIDTGSYSLNALLSGSIYGGLPDNIVTGLAGEPATGKTFYAISIANNFLKSDPNNFVFYFESENAVTRKTLESRSVDVDRVAIVPVSTVEEFRTEAMKLLEKYTEAKEKSRMMFVLDSLGNLSTNKEVKDITEGSEKRDMTRAQLIRGAFRVLTLKLGKAKVPLLCTNHVYDVTGSYVPIKKMGGGSGLEYAASVIPFLSKKKDKDKDSNVTGAIITLVLKKGRHTIENKSVQTLLNYETGLDRYYGLLPLAEKFGIFKKVSTKYEMPDGTKAFESEILKNPEKFYTKDVLDEIDSHCKKEFIYGGTLSNADIVAEEEQQLVSTDTYQLKGDEQVSYGFEPITSLPKKKGKQKNESI